MHIIREYTETDLDDVLSAWESTQQIAHPFLKEDFQAQEKNIQELYRPNADTWVVEDDHHGKKLGKLMVDKAQELHDDLEVVVFEKNSIGRNFYSQYGFSLVEEKVHEQTGERVLRLKFTANKAV